MTSICTRIPIPKDRLAVFTNYPSVTKNQALEETVLTLFRPMVHDIICCMHLALLHVLVLYVVTLCTLHGRKNLTNEKVYTKKIKSCAVHVLCIISRVNIIRRREYLTLHRAI